MFKSLLSELSFALLHFLNVLNHKSRGTRKWLLLLLSARQIPGRLVSARIFPSLVGAPHVRKHLQSIYSVVRRRNPLLLSCWQRRCWLSPKTLTSLTCLAVFTKLGVHLEKLFLTLDSICLPIELETVPVRSHNLCLQFSTHLGGKVAPISVEIFLSSSLFLSEVGTGLS